MHEPGAGAGPQLGGDSPPACPGHPSGDPPHASTARDPLHPTCSGLSHAPPLTMQPGMVAAKKGSPSHFSSLWRGTMMPHTSSKAASSSISSSSRRAFHPPATPSSSRSGRRKGEGSSHIVRVSRGWGVKCGRPCRVWPQMPAPMTPSCLAACLTAPRPPRQMAAARDGERETWTGSRPSPHPRRPPSPCVGNGRA